MEFKLKTFDIPIEVSRIAYVHYFEFTGQYRTVDDFHNFCELLYVDNGAITVRASEYAGILESGQMIIHRPNEIHSLECIDGAAPNVIIIGFECNAAELEQFSSKPFLLGSDHKRMLADVMKEGMNVYSPPFDLPNTRDMKKRTDFQFGADQMLKIRLEMLLISLVRDGIIQKTMLSGDGTAESKMSEIRNYIDEHYREKIQLDNLCFLFGTNKTTLCQSFKRLYGTTVLDYINGLRIKEAKRLLRERELSITQISERLGFSSIHYFCRLFKKTTGQAPKEYIKTVKAKLEL